MAETSDDSTDGPTDQAIRDLLDAEQHRRAVDERRRRHGARQLADESVSFADVIGALAAHGTVVALQTTAGAVPPAVICETGRDYLAVRSERGPVRLVPIAQIAAATPVGSTTGPPAPAGSPPLALVERLRELAVRRTDVRLSDGSWTITGRLRRVGVDVAVLDPGDGSESFVALRAITEVVVDP